MKKKQTLRSSTERLTAATPSMSTGSKVPNHPLNATAKVSAFQTKETTPLIKLTKVEDQQQKLVTSLNKNLEENKTVQEESGYDGVEAEAASEPIAEVFKQRLVSHRR